MQPRAMTVFDCFTCGGYLEAAGSNKIGSGRSGQRTEGPRDLGIATEGGRSSESGSRVSVGGRCQSGVGAQCFRP